MALVRYLDLMRKYRYHDIVTSVAFTLHDFGEPKEKGKEKTSECKNVVHGTQPFLLVRLLERFHFLTATSFLNSL